MTTGISSRKEDGDSAELKLKLGNNVRLGCFRSDYRAENAEEVSDES
jgi:hypothetical protein